MDGCSSRHILHSSPSFWGFVLGTYFKKSKFIKKHTRKKEMLWRKVRVGSRLHWSGCWAVESVVVWCVVMVCVCRHLRRRNVSAVCCAVLYYCNQEQLLGPVRSTSTRTYVCHVGVSWAVADLFRLDLPVCLCSVFVVVGFCDDFDRLFDEFGVWPRVSSRVFLFFCFRVRLGINHTGWLIHHPPH